MEQKKNKKVSFLLAGSLAVNAALFGIVGGQFLGNNGIGIDEKPPNTSRERPHIERVFGQLEKADREKLFRTMKEHWRSSKAERATMHAKHLEVLNAIRAEPFDRGQVELGIKEFMRVDSELKTLATTGILDVMETLPPEARVALADSFLLRNRKPLKMKRDSQREEEGFRPSPPDGPDHEGRMPPPPENMDFPPEPPPEGRFEE